jgi:hypothetical protein
VLSQAAMSSLKFYREVQHLDFSREPVRQAFSFARGFGDLARRILAVQAAQNGETVQYPPGLELAALNAHLDGGRNLSAKNFCSAMPDLHMQDAAETLGAVASWYASVHDVNDPLASSFQVWAGDPGSTNIVVTGPPADPPAPLSYSPVPPVQAWLESQAGRQVAVITHYDTHGLAMLALTLRYLRGLGIEDIDCIMSFELTGDISKLWKRTVPGAITSESNYAAVILIDCSVHSRKPEHTLKAVSRLDAAPDCRLILVDHHDDTALQAPQMMRPGLHIALTDVPGCTLGTAYAAGETDRALAMLGAMGDKDAGMVSAYSQTCEGLGDVVAECHRWMVHYSPTPKHMKEQGQMPLEPLWKALAAGGAPTTELVSSALGELPPAKESPLPSHAVCGGIVITTERLPGVGRTWYSMLEKLMEQNGRSYAIALRILDGRRANMLMLTHWRAIHLPPIRHFVPEQYWPRCLGHYAAVWLDVDKSQALDVIGDTVDELNRFLGTDGSFAEVGESITKNILDAPPSDPRIDEEAK